MKAFARLFQLLDQTTGVLAKQRALEQFFTEADPRDAIWALALFTHRRPRRTVSTTLLRQWAAEIAKVPQWLFEESYHVVGDLAETIALLIPAGTGEASKLLADWIEEIRMLKGQEEEAVKAFVLAAWKGLTKEEIFLFNKLITGGFRVGVSEQTVIKALSKLFDLAPSQIAHRISGIWEPTGMTLTQLIASGDSHDPEKPYPFYLAYPIEESLDTLGSPLSWQIEWKWDGIRGQGIYRQGVASLWSRGEDRINDSFPEIIEGLKKQGGGVVLDGEVICGRGGKVLPFSLLQKRLGRKTVGKKLLEEAPVVFIVYDLLEWEEADIRELPQKERRAMLEKWHRTLSEELQQVFWISEVFEASEWEAVERRRLESKHNGSEGLMLKRLDGVYKTGRKKGEWWKWKVEAETVDAVMIYAQRGHGRRANLYTDFTFAARDGTQWVPFAKAYSGLTDEEFVEVNKWIKDHTIESFGPVRSVEIALVFEIAFEGIMESKRHKSGIALRFPRIKRWRKDKQSEEAVTLAELLLMVNG